jgi:multidrug efflux pump subunit AcrA (membrane-fusion protein)
VAAADAELDASRAAVVRARDAEAAAGRALAEAVASGDADRIAREQARLDAAALATAAAEARTGDAQAEVDGLAAARAAADEARAALSAADAAVFEAEEAVVAAQDARRTGAAVDAQTVAAAESEVERARAALRVLETDGGPGAADGGAGGTSPEEARVAVKRAELEVERARAALDRLTIVAPTDGTVTAVKAQLGQVLGDDGAPAGDTGAAGDAGAGGTAAGDAGGTGGGTVGTSPADVITITTPQQLVAEIDVAETEAIDLRSGMPAELKYAAVPDFVGRGTVLTVTPASTSGSGGGPAGGDPYADAGGGSGAQGRRYTVAIGLSDPPDGVRGGLTVAARVTIATVEDVLAVPTAALTQADGRVTVQRVVSEDGREGPATEEVEVGTGVRQGGWTEVVDGLSPGDRVLVTGAPVEGDPGAFEEVGLVG